MFGCFSIAKRGEHKVYQPKEEKTEAVPGKSHAKMDRCASARFKEDLAASAPKSGSFTASLDIKERGTAHEKVVSVKRSQPPLGMHDSVVGFGGKMDSPRGSALFFEDEEIQSVSSIVAIEELPSGMKIYRSENNKVVLQQQSKRGCTAAAGTMLILDHGKKADLNVLPRCNLWSTKVLERLIQESGLDTFRSDIHPGQPLKRLREKILTGGSAIISVDDPKLGGHCIIADFVEEDLSAIRIRDPFHGMEFTVGRDAFLKRFKGGEIVQIDAVL